MGFRAKWGFRNHGKSTLTAAKRKAQRTKVADEFETEYQAFIEKLQSEPDKTAEVPAEVETVSEERELDESVVAELLEVQQNTLVEEKEESETSSKKKKKKK